MTPVYERAMEFELLRKRVADLRAGCGAVVVIEGRAGAGKTTLVDAAVQLGRRARYDVRAARARVHERPQPGATLGRLGLADAAEPQAAMRASGPLVVAVDDLHLADTRSIAVLLEIADRTDDLAVLLVVALRPGEWPPGDIRLHRLRGSARAVLRPAPLSTVGVRDVLAEHGRAPPAEGVERQTAWTAGNPFLVAAVAAAGGEERSIPDAVATAVSRELGRLSDAEAALARALSILGSGAPLRRVARLAQLDRPAAERAADRLARAGMLAPGDPLRFHAPIEGAAIAAAIEPFARARAHRHAAEALIEEVADIVEIADHLLLTYAGGDAELVAILRAAADRELTGGRPDRAVRYLERALAEPPPATERDETVLELVNAEALCATASSIDRVQRLADRLAGGRARAQALRRLAALQFHGNAAARAADTLRLAMELVDEDDELREAVLGDYLAAASLVPSLRDEASAVLAELIRAIAGGGPLPRAPGLRVQVVSAMATAGAPRERVLPIVDELLRTNPAGEGPPFGLFGDWLSGACIHIDEIELAERVAERSHRAARDGVSERMASYRLGLAHLHCGRLDEAAMRLEAALGARDAGATAVAPPAAAALGARDADSTAVVPAAAAALCAVELERGRPDAAARALDRARDADPAAPHACVVLEARGHLELAGGNAARALEHYEASGIQLAESLGVDPPTLVPWRSDAVFAIRAGGGDLARAQALAGEELATARSIGGARQIARALRAVAATRPEAAVDLLREALAVVSATGPRLEHVRVLADLGEALVAAGDPAAAREPLLDALEAADASGADALAKRARRLLRAAGMRPRRTRRAGAGALTAAELRVAALAASGRSSPAIAELLTISERTVESHLYNTFRKLGVHRREDLAERLPPDAAQR